MSLRELAAASSYSRSYLSELENGKKQPTAEAAEHLDRVLNACGQLTVMVLSTPTGPNWPGGEGEPAGWSGVLRNAPLGPTPAAPPLLGLTGSGDAIDPTIVDSLAQVAAHYRRAYHAVPASRLLPAALAHLDLVLSLHPASQPDGPRVTLLTTAGEMAALAGVLLGLDASQYRAALSHLDLAWSAARAALDIDLQAVVLGCRSFALAYGGGDHQAGLECAGFARDVAATGASPETRGWVAAVASERCASLGDLAGCQARLEESRQVLSADDAGATWRGIGGYGLEKAQAYEGGDMLRLGRYRDAETILSAAFAALDPAQQRHRATALVDRASARLGLGDVDAACLDGAQALGLVTAVQHAGNLDRIGDLAEQAAATGAQSGRALRRDVQLVRTDHGLQTRWATR
jgi:tetratricopeptide (TPR) repeat protein